MKDIPKPQIVLPPEPSFTPSPRKFRPLKETIVVFRIDPIAKATARLTVDVITDQNGSGSKGIARLCRTDKLGWQRLGISVDVEGHELPLVAAGEAEISSAVPGWKLKVGDLESPVTGGLSVLFCMGPRGGMCSPPAAIDVIWLREHLIWDDGTPEDAPGGSDADA